MTHLLGDKRITTVWAVLIAATLVSVWLGTDHGLDDGRVAGVVLMVVAFVKVWLVGMHFMELRDAPRPLRLLFEGWCAAIGVAVITLFVLA